MKKLAVLLVALTACAGKGGFDTPEDACRSVGATEIQYGTGSDLASNIGEMSLRGYCLKDGVRVAAYVAVKHVGGTDGHWLYRAREV